MEKLQISARLKIKDGKLKEFKELADQCISIVKEKDKGNLQYDWFISLDGSECVVRETYVDSDAVINHVMILGDLLGKLLAISEMSIEAYGTPSAELLKITTAFNPKIYGFYKGK